MATIGLTDLYVAKINTTDGVESYDSPVELAKAIKAEMSVEVAEGILYANDSADIIAKEFVKGALKLNINDLEPAKAAMLLGQYMDENNIIFAGGSDEPPYFAVGFRAKKPTGGKYRYVWLYKVKFKTPNENYETKGSGINFITPEIEGEFITRDQDGMWKADYTGVPTDAIAKTWFTTVKECVKKPEIDPAI